jgi:GNAT superfamily N-acetyltransferase
MNDVIVRAPTLDDAHSVAALIAARDRADFTEADSISFTGDELNEWWRLDEKELATDAWIALIDGEVVAYTRAECERDLANLADESCVHPGARGLGIGSRLLDLAERWAGERGLARTQMHVVGDDGRKLAEDRGHELVRYFWRMEIELADEPSEPGRLDGRTIGASSAATTTRSSGGSRSTAIRSPARRCASAGAGRAGCSTSSSAPLEAEGSRPRPAAVRTPRTVAARPHACRARGRLGERDRSDAPLRARGDASHPTLRDIREGAGLRPVTLSREGP